MRSLPVCAVLFALLPAFAQARTLCHAVAKSITSLMPSDVSDGRRASPVEVLDRSSGGVVSVDRQAWPGTSPADLLVRLRNDDKAPPALLEAMQSLSGRNVFRFGRDSLFLGRTVQGSAACQGFVFFEARSGGPSRLVEGPSGMGLGDEMAYCFGSQGHAGEIDGVPAFIAQRDGPRGVDLSIATWRDGRWQKPCHVALSFDDAFDATERFCDGADCDQVAEQARSLVKELDETLRQGGLPDMSRLTGQSGLDKRLPTFGKEPANPDHRVYAEFQGDALFLPIVVANEMYLARVGHAGFAWRRSPNYLFAAYRMTGDHLEPVAGIYVDRVRSTLTGAEVD